MYLPRGAQDILDLHSRILYSDSPTTFPEIFFPLHTICPEFKGPFKSPQRKVADLWVNKHFQRAVEKQTQVDRNYLFKLTIN